MKIVLIFVIMAVALLGETQTVLIKVTGMTCPICTTAIKKSLKKVKGVQKAKVRLNTEIATVSYEKNVTQAELLQAVKDVGYLGVIISVK